MSTTAVPAIDRRFSGAITDNAQSSTAAHITKELNPQYFVKPVERLCDLQRQ